MTTLKKFKSTFKVTGALALGFLLCLLVNVVFAKGGSGGAINLTSITETLSGTIKNVGKILIDVSVITGIGFILVAFFKFHAHKNNPQQIPLSQGISLLVIGAALTVFPYLIGGVSKAGFGQSKVATAGAASKMLGGN